MGLRIALLDASPADGWSGPTGLFQEAAHSLSNNGHDVQLIDTSGLAIPSPSTPLPPLWTALNRAVAAQPMIESHRLAHTLASSPPDLLIAPVHGGLAQATLMARACGEAFPNTRIALWANRPTRDRFLISDSTHSDLSPLISDAMERQCFDLADALILSESKAQPSLMGTPIRSIPIVICPRLSRSAATDMATVKEIEEIVFMGALRRMSGTAEFIHAIEQLASDGILGSRLVTFLGPMNDFGQGLSKEWLGKKATNWPFRFRVINETDRTRALEYARKDKCLVVCIGLELDEIRLLRACSRNYVLIAAQPMCDSHLPTNLANSIAAALQGRGSTDQTPAAIDWPGLVEKLMHGDLQRLPRQQARICVCILHHNRLRLLRQAIASIPDQIDGHDVEVIVVDNASPIPDVEREICEVAGNRPNLRVLALAAPLLQAAAYNRALAEAHSDIVAFLDDDNLFLADGLERLAKALSTGRHDIVVSPLDVFDGPDGATAPTEGRIIFLGTAHSAGLFFNAFGDTAMAVHRKAFMSLGGFRDQGYDYPCLDWISLARAQSAGLRIGALQWPAIRYRRDIARADKQPNKLDEAGARALVFASYRGTYDGDLLTRYAQKLQLKNI